MNKLPSARSNDIIVQELEKEILIYDLKKHKAYSLNETLSIVYKACDGNTTFNELKTEHKFTDDIIFLALDELKKDDLMEDSNSFVSPFVGMNRREVIRKVGFASMIALPIITSLVAPLAAHGQSAGATGATCTSGNQCSSGTCNGTCSAGGGICSNFGGVCNAQGTCNGAGSCSTGGSCPGVNGSICFSTGTCSSTGKCT